MLSLAHALVKAGKPWAVLRGLANFFQLYEAMAKLRSNCFSPAGPSQALAILLKGLQSFARPCLALQDLAFAGLSMAKP